MAVIGKNTSKIVNADCRKGTQSGDIDSINSHELPESPLIEQRLAKAGFFWTAWMSWA